MLGGGADVSDYAGKGAGGVICGLSGGAGLVDDGVELAGGVRGDDVVDEVC